MINPPTDEQMRREALKANLRDKLTDRLRADVRRLMSEAGGYPLDDEDIRDIVSEAAQTVNIMVKRGMV